MSIERRTISALKWTAGTRLLGQSASWVVTLMLFRILTPVDYGLMALVSVVVSIVSGSARQIDRTRSRAPRGGSSLVSMTR